MNYLKIQTDILKMLDKDDKRNRVLVGVLGDDEIAVTLDGYVLYRIPQDKFYLDINKIPGNQLKVDLLFNFSTIDAVKSNSLKKVRNVTLVRLESEKDHAWVDGKLLKLFNDDCTFALSKEKPLRSLVKVFEKGICVGIVLPFNVGD